VTAYQVLPGRSLYQETHIIMLVGRLRRILRNEMDVDVQGGGDASHGQGPQPREPRFLSNLPQGHGEDVRIAVCVTTGLQPPVELSVMVQHAMAMTLRDHPGRPRDMPGHAGPFETIGVGVDEVEEAFQAVTVFRPDLSMEREEIKEGSPVHGQSVTDQGMSGSA